ncbi:adenosylcobinamide-phosphate synthase CbiB [Rhizobium sp. XQZ8]|uniref:adenosylcobinamide-phosphate synthase CbiB n=1 Tax=Rhizobium populisoli TaxID=2859785 RepID=UPI001CA47CC1|nr:adenosylcobinamide-phosphate synthase CbiB [Rhizobium populisoli]MBW6424433.1 adenosylcobinamide-phosphate synthase CbiB [Rhizobium populisoli]
MFLLAFAALIVERIVGYPDWVYRRIGHPVTWIGRLISRLDRDWNRETDSFAKRKSMGVAALLVILILVTVLSLAIEWDLRIFTLGWIPLIVIAASLPAQKSLERHVEAVADALQKSGLAAGRKAVSRIVGRDPEKLDEAAVCRAAIESLAENFSDGVVAPAFWMGIGGLAGGAAYKAANTADSMIGHRNARFEAFGWAAARFDDLINLPASRLTALLFVMAAGFMNSASPENAIKAIRRDAKHHRSPNAGWPEAAMAGALGIALAGPRSYGGVMIEARFMGEGGRTELTHRDIRHALKLARIADALLIGLFGLLAWTIWQK